MREHEVQCLLMGGQACIVYGAAEFSRDADLAVLADAANLRRLGAAIDELQGEVIAVPPFEAKYLARGHAVHFRCGRSDVDGMRVDVMSRMRGVDEFAVLWERRTTLTIPETEKLPSLDLDVMGLHDLVQAKKTQRDKDWPMIRRLLEVNWFEHREQATDAHVLFWLRELRSPALLVECADAFTAAARGMSNEREAVSVALAHDTGGIERALADEQERERALDRAYWAPLRQELESLRRSR